MGFNSAFKGLIDKVSLGVTVQFCSLNMCLQIEVKRLKFSN